MIKLSAYVISASASLLLVAACIQQEQSMKIQGYDLAAPAETYKLPKDLQEVSGACYWKKDKLALVQDEDDIVYIYDTDTKQVVDKVAFHKDGDHEGIASDGENLFVLRSDGDLFKLEDLKGKKTKSEHWKNALKAENDVEGLCYDKRKKRFLLACKGKPGVGLSGKDHRTVWGVSAKNGRITTKPVLILEKEKINALLSKKKGKTVKSKFAPSAIEIQPKTGNIWIASARGNVLAVYSNKGELLDAVLLSNRLFKQPEALTFAPNGDLFIANEGKDKKAVMYRFERN